MTEVESTIHISMPDQILLDAAVGLLIYYPEKPGIITVKVNHIVCTKKTLAE